MGRSSIRNPLNQINHNLGLAQPNTMCSIYPLHCPRLGTVFLHVFEHLLLHGWGYTLVTLGQQVRARHEAALPRPRLDNVFEHSHRLGPQRRRKRVGDLPGDVVVKDLMGVEYGEEIRIAGLEEERKFLSIENISRIACKGSTEEVKVKEDSRLDAPKEARKPAALDTTPSGSFLSPK